MKSLPVWKALDENTLVAYEMNGAAAAALERLPGSPHRAGLDRHLLDEAPDLDHALAKPFDGFWMKSAYRIPLGRFPRSIASSPGNRRQHADHRDGGQLADHEPCGWGDGDPTGRPLDLAGIAWDGGRASHVSRSPSTMAPRGGRRNSAKTSGGSRSGPGNSRFENPGKGRMGVLVNATNAAGQTQVATAIFNPARLPSQRHAEADAPDRLRRPPCRVRLMKAACVAGLLLAPTLARAADEFAIKLKPGPGVEVVQTQCAACHSLDYILMNSPFPDAKLWSAEVTKMISAFGADIKPADAQAIADYLAKNYGS